LKVFENSTIWHSLQEDQYCSVPPSFDLETTTGQRNEVPEAPSDPQEISQVPPGQGGVNTFTLQISKGSGPGTPNYKKSIRTFDEGDPQQWMDVITGLREIWAQNSIRVPTDMSNTVVALLKGDSITAYEVAMKDSHTNPEDEPLWYP
jgi:hypothetical protein